MAAVWAVADHGQKGKFTSSILSYLRIMKLKTTALVFSWRNRGREKGEESGIQTFPSKYFCED